MPWRETSDPWAIMVSEFMLQQTQVATVIPYYEMWMARFPTPAALAQATEDEALSLWQGLGYYRRCRLLKSAAEAIVANGMPADHEGLKALPGFGDYTAAAVASIAFGQEVAVVDGNVLRVYSRFAADASVGPKLHKAAREWANSSIHWSNPSDFNQALMELGATVCTKANPKCNRCPLQPRCEAYAKELVNRLPTPKPRQPAVELEFECWIPMWEGKLGVRQITSGPWWVGMWEFPRGSAEELSASLSPAGRRCYLGTVKHTVTKHKITLRVSSIEMESSASDLRWVTTSELEALPMPSLQRKAFRLMSKQPPLLGLGAE